MSRVNKRGKSKPDRDVEKGYTPKQLADKLRGLADALESGSAFRIQVAGERVIVPKGAVFTIEHEREGQQEELEFQCTWHPG